MSPEDLAKERKRFTRENLQADGGGVLLFPNTYSDIQQIESKPFVVDAEQMKLIQTNVYNYFGVNEMCCRTSLRRCLGSFLRGRHRAVCHPVLRRGHENAVHGAGAGFRLLVMATANRLQYMSNADKLKCRPRWQTAAL